MFAAPAESKVSSTGRSHHLARMFNPLPHTVSLSIVTFRIEIQKRQKKPPPATTLCCVIFRLGGCPRSDGVVLVMSGDMQGPPLSNNFCPAVHATLYDNSCTTERLC